MVLFTGDLFINKDIQINKDVRDYINNSTHVVTNLESVVENDSFHKRSDKNSILTCREASLNKYINYFKTNIAFNLCNNHIHDLGEDGIEYTKKTLSKYKNINYFGVDYYTEIIKPFIINTDNKRIAILPVSTDSPEVTSVCATKKSQGVLDYKDSKVIDIIKKTKPLVDYFVIIPHWGREFVDYPNINLRNLAYKWIDAGADIVIGSHPHIIRGKENYNGKWIYYSLGNYIFPNYYDKSGVYKEWKKESNYSVMLKISFKDEIQIEESGLMYNTHANILSFNKISLNYMNEKSIVLDKERVPFKDYFGVWENNYIKNVVKYYKISFIKRLFPKHKYYSRILFFIKRVQNVIIG